MWWPTQARAPLATQKVLFSSAPQASSGRAPRPAARALAGHVAARAAHHQRPRRRTRPHDRVVGARVDRPVVDEEQVGDAREPLERVVVVVGDRLVGDVAARQHERAAGVARAAGGAAASTASITPSSGDARRDGARHRRAAAGAARARSGGAREPSSASLVRRRARRAPRPPATSRRHQRERPVLAVLARAQRAPPRRSSAASHARW